MMGRKGRKSHPLLRERDDRRRQTPKQNQEEWDVSPCLSVRTGSVSGCPRTWSQKLLHAGAFQREDKKQRLLPRGLWGHQA